MINLDFFNWLKKKIWFIKFKLFSEPKIRLPDWVKSKADRKFNKLLGKFKRSHGNRSPTKNEMFRIIINASHITLRRNTKRGHWGRQKVRKYLLEKHGVVKEYKPR